jgi:hypothetical protein
MSRAQCLAKLTESLDSMMRSPIFLDWLRLTLAVQNTQLFWLRQLGLYPRTPRSTFSLSESRRRTN